MVQLFKRYVSYRRIALVVGDAVVVYVAVYAVVAFPWRGLESDAQVETLRSTAIVVGLTLAILSLNELHEWRVSSDGRERNRKLLVSCGVVLIGIALFVYALQVLGLESLFRFPSLSPEHSSAKVTQRLMAAVIAAFSGLAVWRWFYHWGIGRWRFQERLLVLGAGPVAESFTRELGSRHDAGFEIVALVATGGERPWGESEGRRRLPLVYSDLERLHEIARGLRAHRVVVALSDRRGTLPMAPLLECKMAGIPVENWETIYERITGKIAVESLRPSYLIFGEGFRKSRLVLATKRALDVSLALVGLVVTAPISLFTAVLIRLDSTGPILFRQQRVGRNDEDFVLYKFRSMRVDAERDTGPVWARPLDDRVTRIGRWIRRTRVDELPQLWNVLLGNMSFVGPRPERRVFVDVLNEEIDYYKQRLTVKPGITGWAQINYPYGSSKEDALNKLEYDLYYVKNMTVGLDLYILFRTIEVVFLRKGSR